MSQTPDIVERLRETDWGKSVTDTLARWDAARADAADTIEALRARVAELERIAHLIVEDVSSIERPTKLSVRTVERIVWDARKALGDKP